MTVSWRGARGGTCQEVGRWGAGDHLIGGRSCMCDTARGGTCQCPLGEGGGTDVLESRPLDWPNRATYLRNAVAFMRASGNDHCHPNMGTASCICYQGTGKQNAWKATS
jgi:hypothetical protein